MEVVMAIVIGGLYTGGIYLLMRRNLAKLIMGLVLMSHGASLLIVTAGGLVRARAPIVPAGQMQVIPPVADPLPQALTLTAIVISFGVLAFVFVLFNRTYNALKTDDLDDLKSTDT